MNTVLIYSKTGGTKSTQLARIAEELIRHYKAQGIANPRGRLITADSGYGPMDHLIASPDNPEGPMEALDLHSLGNPFGALGCIGDGRWLEITQASEKEAAKLSWSKDTRVPNNMCFYFLEGFNTIGSCLLQDHVDAGRKIAEDVVGKVSIASNITGGGTATHQLGAPGRAHYGNVQMYMLETLLPKLKKIRRLDGSNLPWVIFTAHEAMGEDSLTDKPILGPASVGKASTGVIAQKFQDTIHIHKVVDKATGEIKELRGYFRDHPELSMPTPGSGFFMWPAKISFPSEVAKQIHMKYKDGFFPITWDSGLEELIKFRLNMEIK